MVKTTIKVVGMKEATFFLHMKGREAISLAEDGVETSTELLVNEVKASIKGEKAEPESIDTGDFEKSVTGKSSRLKGTVSSDEPQSAFMEFGTTEIPARRHFKNSMRRNENKIVDIIRKEVNRL